MKSKIIIKTRLVEDEKIINEVKTKGDVNLMLNGLIDVLHTICEEKGIDKNDVINTFKKFNKNIIKEIK